MTDLRREGDVFVLDLGDDENRFNPGSIAAIGAALDDVEAADGASLVTVGSGKQYSSGLDLGWLSDPTNSDEAAGFVAEVQRLLARLVVFPGYTVAAINGHAFAAGAMLSAAHDLRLMRDDRGYWCLPEVDLGLPFTPGMTALLRAKLPPAAANAALVTGRRFDGPAAAAQGIVDGTVAQDALLDRAVSLAAEQAGKAGAVRQIIKRGLYGEVEQALLAPLDQPPSSAVDRD